MSPTAFHRRAASAALSALALLVVATPAAHAEPVHEVAPGESLWQIAAVNGMSAAALAAANGLPATTAVQAGQTLRIPAAGATATPTVAPAAATPSAAPAPASQAVAGASAGGVVVQPGETLSSIAARHDVSVTTLAAHNGLNASALLPAGRSLSVPSGASAGAGAAPSAGATTAGAATAAASSGSAASSSASGSPSSSAAPSASTASSSATASAPAGGATVTAEQVGAAAAQNDVPASLARAIAWQESGFNNGAVSSAGARGVMQVMPGTWSWIGSSLADRALDPSSAADNVHAGTLYLKHLLRETGGDTDQAAAAYYQGLSSVRSRGLYDDTKRYVENVRALQARFGG